MTPQQVDFASAEEVAPQLWRIETPHGNPFIKSVNAYVIETGSELFLVDSGINNDQSWEILTAALTGLGFDPSGVRRIVLTHFHPDHAGLALRFQQLHSSEVSMHEQDVEYAAWRWSDSDDGGRQQHAWLVRYGFPFDEAEHVATLPGEPRIPAVIEPDIRFAGGEVLEMGRYRFEVLWTPGHTPGHVSFYDPVQQVLMCGDHVLQNVAPNVGLRPDGSNDNLLPGYLASLRQLAEMPVKLALPGHGKLPSFSDRVHELIQHQMDRRERAQALMTSTLRTPYQLAPLVWNEDGKSWAGFAPRVRRNAVATLAAHLELLADDGLIAREAADTVSFASKRHRA